MRKFLRKIAASLLKRFYIITNDGYSIGSAYGGRFLFDWRHSLDKKVALELYEYEQINYFLTVLNKVAPNLFLDIGAHSALYSIIAGNRQPGIEIHAFEPDRTNLNQLYANIFLNKFDTPVTVHEFGLSDSTGRTAFINTDKASSRGTRRIAADGNSDIPIKRLDDVLNVSDRTAILKIDVEGHEMQVIDGGRSFLERNRCFLQIESSPDVLKKLREQLSGLGYRHIKTISDHYFSNITDLPGEN